ncbi:MAG: GFA family protein [Deltaproteobacteria bacterium]|nr:GFA family protein [Deltaproteobacteria bacterium]
MLTGRCLCGEVTYEIEGKISPIWLCHCSKCRRWTGSAFHASAACSPDRFHWLSGVDSIGEYEDTPSYKVRFCKRCGTPVPWHDADRDLVFVHVGGLNEDPGRAIAHHIFVGSKAPWFEILDDRAQYEEHRPQPDGAG